MFRGAAGLTAAVRAEASVAATAGRMDAARAAPAARWYQPLDSGPFRLVLAIVHAYFLSSFYLVAALPLYVQKAPKWQVGLVVSVPFVASMVLRPFTGRVTDRYGRRVFLALGALLSAATLAAHAVSADVWYLTGVRLAYGAASAFITTAIMASLADVLPADRRGAGMGWYGIFYTSGYLYGPYLGLWLVRGISYTALFAFGVALNLVCLLLTTALPETRLHRSSDDPPPKLFSRSAVFPMLTFLSITIPAGAVSAFLALFEKQRHGGDPGVFFALYGAAMMLGRVLGGLLADRYSRRAAILPGLAIVGLAMLALSAAHPAVAFYAVGLAYGLGFALGHTGATILAMDRAPIPERGAAMATLIAAWDVGTVLGAFVLGFFADAAGYPAIFIVVGLVPLAWMVPFVLTAGRMSSR